MAQVVASAGQYLNHLFSWLHDRFILALEIEIFTVIESRLNSRVKVHGSELRLVPSTLPRFF